MGDKDVGETVWYNTLDSHKSNYVWNGQIGATLIFWPAFPWYWAG